MSLEMTELAIGGAKQPAGAVTDRITVAQLANPRLHYAKTPQR
jgi:hypothetical protein|tara:strand:- start:215 stop:343 length:129 start_codon:yes stop_codon:yes gene_type:complete